MALSLHSSNSATMATLQAAVIFMALFVIPAHSTSRKVTENLTEKQTITSVSATGFRVRLKHFDSERNLTGFQRLQRGIKRGRHRLQRLSAMVLASKSENSEVVESPVNAGHGEYLMELAIGTPPSTFSAILDTGSDLIWTQCTPCTQCFQQSTPIFDPKQSSTFSKLSCSSNLCNALPSSTCSDGCEYFYSYGDYSSTQGVLATETFTFGDSESQVPVPNIGFGCGEDNEGDGFNQGAGLVGLGRGPLSLVSQLKEPKFSYCLTSIGDSKTSLLLMGSSANLNSTASSSDTIIKTPLVKNRSQPSFYYLTLQGISVGGKHLPIDKDTFALHDDGSGGLIIDSGTTITYLEQKAFDALKDEFISQTNLPVDSSGSQGLDLCFQMPSSSSSSDQAVQVPKLVFHFDGADLEFPPENYMLGDPDLGVLCLAMGASSGLSILGNFQQQNTLVVHDLAEDSLSFVPTQCDRL